MFRSEGQCFGIKNQTPTLGNPGNPKKSRNLSEADCLKLWITRNPKHPLSESFFSPAPKYETL